MAENKDNKDKQLNVRLTDKDLDEFKAYADERNISQTDAFILAFTALKAEQQKQEQPGNKKYIGEAQRHANALVDIVVKMGDEKAKAEQNAEDKYQGRIEQLEQTVADVQALKAELEKEKARLSVELEDSQKALELATAKLDAQKAEHEKELAELKLAAAEEKKPLEMEIERLRGRLEERETSGKK